MTLTPKQSLNFWSKIKVAGKNECWNWIGAFGGIGNYGCFGVSGTIWRCNRLMFAMANSLSRDELPTYVCHRCDNPSCVNPNHLFAGDPRINTHDMISKGRHRLNLNHPFGEQHCCHKLTEKQVLEIFRRRKAGEGQRALAREFGVKHSAIYQIERGMTWARTTKHKPK